MDLEKQAADFRRAVTQAGPRGRTTSYPVELRKRAVQYVRARVAEGAAAGRACRELGIGTDSFRRWSIEAVESPPSVSAAFRAVALAATMPAVMPATGRMTVHGPGGLRIEGIDLASLVELIRRLG